MPKETSKPSESVKFKVTTEYFFTAVSAWLVPGLGHWLLGHRARGMMLGISILGLFWVGEALAVPPPGAAYPRKPLAVTHKVNPIFFSLQAGNGFSAILADTLWGKPVRDANRLDTLDRSLPIYLNLGILFTSVSGLLNFLLVIHILDPRTWVPLAAKPPGKPSKQGVP